MGRTYIDFEGMKMLIDVGFGWPLQENNVDTRQSFWFFGSLNA
jgi:hypothetical protein